MRELLIKLELLLEIIGHGYASHLLSKLKDLIFFEKEKRLVEKVKEEGRTWENRYLATKSCKSLPDCYRT